MPRDGKRLSKKMLLTEEQEHARDTAHEFAQRALAPFSAEWESRATFPRAALRELGKLGFMGMTVPTEWDGAGADYVAYALSLEEIAAGDGAVSTIVSGHNSVGCMPLVEYGTPEQKEKYLRPMARGEMLSAFCLTEPQSGSDAGAIRTRAEKRRGSYIINGTKQFITSGKNADVALVFAATDLGLGPKGISCFIVDTKQKGYSIGRVESKMGQQASDCCEVCFDELCVSEENRLGADAAAFQIRQRDPVALALGAEPVLFRHAEFVKTHFAAVRRLLAHFALDAADRITLLFGIDDEAADAFRPKPEVGRGKDQSDVGVFARGDELLGAVDNVAVAPLLGAGSDGTGIRAALRLGQAEGAQHLAARHGAQILFLLLGRPVFNQRHASDRVVPADDRRHCAITRRDLLQRQS